ncbi:MAG: hypothetical protein QXG29_03315 [Sulfolobales archaeon]
MSENLIYVYLSGIHKTLPKAEVMAIAEAENIDTRVVLDADQLLIVYSSSDLIEFLKLRSAYSRRIGRVLWVGRLEDIEDGISRAIEILRSQGIESIKMEFKSLRGLEKERDYWNVVKLLTESGMRLSRTSSKTLDIILFHEIAVVGLRDYELRLKDLFDRWSNRRPAYLPGALNPDISRIFVNLSRASIRQNTIFYDPFCGVGSFLLEACYMGLNYAGSDIDERSVEGALKNLRSYGCTPEVFLADVCRMPIHKVDAIGTDMPYGRQTKPLGVSIIELIKCMLENSESVLKKGSYLVFAQISELEEHVYRYVSKLDFELVEVHRNWVHGSLTRNIYVLRKK